MKTIILVALGTVFTSTAALAGITPIPVSEPGVAGIVAGGVIAAIAIAKLRAKK